MEKRVLIIGAIIIVALIIIVILVSMHWMRLTGEVSYPVDSNREFKSASFSCANGAASQLESKNCRSAAYWKNYADIFCKNLCEPTEDYSLDNAQNQDSSCKMIELNLDKECG